MLSKRKLLTLPLSYSFLNTPESLPGYDEKHGVHYSTEMVDQLMTQPNVIRDLNRFRVQFGEKGECVKFGSYTNSADYCTLIQVAARQEGLDLSIDQVKIIIGYCHSAYGHWIQQGITSLPYGNLDLALFSMHGILFNKDDIDLYHRVTIKNKKIHLSHIFYAEEANIPMVSAKVVNYNRPLIEKKHEYVITEKEGAYDISYVNNKKSVRIDKEFLKKDILPVVKASFAMRSVLEASAANVVVFDIYSYVPFLLDPEFAKTFFAKILEPVSNSGSTKYLSVTQKVELAEKYISTCYADYPKKKNKLLKQLYTEELRSLINDDHVDATKKFAAHQLLLELKKLPNIIQKKNIVILNDILKCTITSIRAPFDADNLARLEEKAHEVNKASWGKKLAGAAMVVLGVALITASVMIAVASFGATSIFSAAGIAIATNILTQALSITGSVLGAALATSGVACVRYTPFKSFYNSTLPFWKGRNKTEPEFSIAETKKGDSPDPEADADTDTCEEGLDRTASCNP
jgi:hypothetical protein